MPGDESAGVMRAIEEVLDRAGASVVVVHPVAAAVAKMASRG
jgi:hypothetical protein